MLAAKSENHIMVVIHKVVVNKNRTIFEMNGNEVESSYSMPNLLQGLLLLIATMTIFSVALNFLISHRGCSPEDIQGSTLDLCKTYFNVSI